MEAFDREDIDPKSIYRSQELPLLTKDEILYHIEMVTSGCCYSPEVSSIYVNWKNSSNILSNCKDNEEEFYKSVERWLNTTQNTIIRCSDDDILKNMSLEQTWITNLLLIKNDIKRLNDY